MILNELWKILCVIGMIAGIGFCAICILMCVLIGVMVIRACLSDDDDILDRQSRSVSEEKNDKEAQSDTENELSWPDGEENESEKMEKDGTWMKRNGKPIYMKAEEEEGM